MSKDREKLGIEVLDSRGEEIGIVFESSKSLETVIRGQYAISSYRIWSALLWDADSETYTMLPDDFPSRDTAERELRKVHDESL